MKKDAEPMVGRGMRTCDPETLACDAVEAVAAQVDRLAVFLFPPGRGNQLRAVSRQERLRSWWRDQALGSELGLAVRHAACFARTGDGQAGAVSENCAVVVNAVFGAALAEPVLDLEEDRLDAALGSHGPLAGTLVDMVLAARTRAHLAVGEDVSIPGLAALTGVATAEVRARLGVTPRVWWVSAARARSWLGTGASQGSGNK